MENFSSWNYLASLFRAPATIPMKQSSKSDIKEPIKHEKHRFFATPKIPGKKRSDKREREREKEIEGKNVLSA